MVNNTQIKQNHNEERLSMRNSIMVWVAGAILGWAVAVVSVWTALNNSADSNIADHAPSQAEQMEKIMPAAGKEQEQNKEEDPQKQ